MKKYDVNIFTDGACSGNPGKGGFGVIMEMVGTDRTKEISELDTQLTTEWNCLSYYWIREP
jgi:ribonuclease HI